MNINTEDKLKNINLDHDEHILIMKKKEKKLFIRIITKGNDMIDKFRSLVFLIEFIIILFFIISIIIGINKINNVIKYIENLPNIIKNGVTSII